MRVAYNRRMKRFTKALFAIFLLSRTTAAFGLEIPDECKKYITPETAAPGILINEVSFKDDPDWIEFYILDDKNNGQGTNLIDFTIRDDGEIKKLPNITLKNGDYFTLTFNSEKSDEPRDLFTKKAGLTGTTEQITIESNYGEIIDAVCWTNENPAEGEKADFLELQEAGQWGGSIEDCLKSTQIKNGASIGRINTVDSNTQNDWQTFSHPTKSQKNEITNSSPVAKITIQSGELVQEESLKINLTAEDSYDPDEDPITFKWDFGDGEISEKENPPIKSYSEQKKYTIILEAKDSSGAIGQDKIQVEVVPKTQESENLPDETNEQTPPDEDPEESSPDETPEEPASYPKILINEIMPNPDGTDTGNEWIELRNPNPDDMDLTDWQLDDEEGGSKPFTIKSLTIPKNGYTIIISNESKLNLNNDSDKVRLFDPKGVIRDEIYYEDAKSGYSLARKDETQWYWTDFPTKGETNVEIIENVEEEKAAEEKSEEENKIYQDGDISDELEITEILPNPDGTDTGSEWIEIHNNSDENINMGNWQLDDSENGSKPYTFSDETTLNKNSYLVVFSKESKLNLGNKNDEVRLLAPDGDTIDEVAYESAPSGMSYAKLQFILDKRPIASLTPTSSTEEKWEWTSKITKGAENPKYEMFTAKVADEIGDKNSFKATVNGTNIEIKFAGETLDPRIAKATLKKDAVLEIEAKKISEDLYELKTYKIKSTPVEEETEKKTQIPKIIAILALATGIFLTSYHFYKIYKKQFESGHVKSYN